MKVYKILVDEYPNTCYECMYHKYKVARINPVALKSRCGALKSPIEQSVFLPGVLPVGCPLLKIEERYKTAYWKLDENGKARAYSEEGVEL